MHKIIQCSFLILFVTITIPTTAEARELRVPHPYRSVQAAVNVASPGDTVVLAPGRYKGAVRIQKDLTLVGAGQARTTIHEHVGHGAVVTIENSTVTISGLEVNGGILNTAGEQSDGKFTGRFRQTSTHGIDAIESDVTLNDVAINNIVNYLVTIERGKLFVENVSLMARSKWMHQADIGIRVRGSTTKISQLYQRSGTLDHTVDINNPGSESLKWGRSHVLVENSVIRASELSWGECIRTYTNSTLTVNSTECYREPGGRVPKYNNHSGVGINGHNNNVQISGNRFIRVPWGVNVFGSKDESNSVVIEENSFIDNEIGGIYVHGMTYQGLDIGGGHLGSKGRNVFKNTKTFDIELGPRSNVTISALNNYWSSTSPEDSIWDQLDDSELGKVRWFGLIDED